MSFLLGLACGQIVLSQYQSHGTNFNGLCGPGSSLGIATELRAGRSGIESRWGRDFPPLQTQKYRTEEREKERRRWKKNRKRGGRGEGGTARSRDVNKCST